MIILDTNVVSEAIKPNRDQKVVAWLNEQAPETLYLTAISLSELLLGVEILPSGKRKNQISTGINQLLDKIFGTRILPFDQDAARIHAPIIAAARASGKTVSLYDGQVAAIAKLHGFAVATRDTNPFTTLNVDVLNPWLFKVQRHL